MRQPHLGRCTVGPRHPKRLFLSILGHHKVKLDFLALFQAAVADCLYVALQAAMVGRSGMGVCGGGAAKSSAVHGGAAMPHPLPSHLVDEHLIL